MKAAKLILILGYFAFCILRLSPCVYAAGEDVDVSGDTQGYSVRLDNVSLPAAGSEGEIRYDADEDLLKVWDGIQWKPLSANKNVATRIVGVRRSPANPALDSLDADRADYICDGSDDQKEINQAIVDIIYSLNVPSPAKIKQGVVYLLDGTYNISTSTFSDYVNPQGGILSIATPGIVINPAAAAAAQSGISIIGSGRGTLLSAPAGSVNVINASNASNILISQLSIWAQDVDTDPGTGSPTGENNTCLSFSNVSDSKIHSVWFYGGDQCVYLTASNNNIISNSIFSVAWFQPVLYLVGSSNNIIRDNMIGNGYSVMLGSGANNNVLSRNNLSASYDCLRIYSSDNNVVSGNVIASSGGGDIWGYFTDANGIIISYSNKNIISDNKITSGGGVYGQNGVAIANSSAGNIIKGNQIYNNRTGISVSTASADSLNFISANHIEVRGDNGLGIYSSKGNAVICANYIYGASASSSWGIQTATGTNTTSGEYISGNLITGGGTAAKKINTYNSVSIKSKTRFIQKEKLTLDQVESQNPGSGGAINPKGSYVRLSSSSSYTLNTTVAIDSGKSDGELLILENIGTGTITLPNNANTKLAANRALGQYDNVVLIWKSDAEPAKSNWLELSYWDN